MAQILTRRVLIAATAAMLLCGGAGLRAETLDEKTPKELEGVNVTEKLGQSVNLDLQFTGEDGYPHSLREYFAKGRPVLLNLVYYSCPMLCNLVLNGQVAALRQLDWTPGKEFEVVTISIDPTENYGLAKNKKIAYLASYDREAPGWHFLTDYNGSTAKLAEQVGFGYRRDDKSGQYAHPAVIFLLTPEGKMSRYLYGVKFKPLDIKLGLIEAAQEKFGISERILFYCFHYDPAAKSFVPFARNFMRIGGLMTVLALGIVLFRLFRRDRRIPHGGLMVNAK